MVYRGLYEGVLRHLPPEAAHRLGFGLIKAAAQIPGARQRSGASSRPATPRSGCTRLAWTSQARLAWQPASTRTARGRSQLAALGFSFIEVGTVTAHPQPGNPKPRMFRFPAERALVNRMGFNNDGAAAVAARLRHLRATTRNPPIIGVNIGKTKAAPEEDAIFDYVTSAEIVADVADYVVVNVSSPNTPGLRDLQETEKLLPCCAPSASRSTRPPPGGASRCW